MESIDLRLEAAMRAYDPIGWKWFDRADQDHPAKTVFIENAQRCMKEALRALDMYDKSLEAEHTVEEIRNDQKITKVGRKNLKAVVRLATECWARLERMYEQQDTYHKNKMPLPSWPRDEFESYLDALRSDAEEALKGD